MTNLEFKKKLNESLEAFGFSKYGNKWSMETDELEKVIYLQKSNYGNQYYINYGFNFKDLVYPEVDMHIWNQLGSKKRRDNKLIFQTLDLTNSIEDNIRVQNLKNIVSEILLPEIVSINKKTDVISYLKSTSNLNDVFLPVKQHLNLEEEEKPKNNSIWLKFKSKLDL